MQNLLLMVDRFTNNLIPGVLMFLSGLFMFAVKAQQPKLVLPIGHTGPVYTANFSADGKRVITGSDDHTAKIWDVQSGALLADLKGHMSRIRNAGFSPDGKKIVTASGDNNARIWDAESGSLLTELKGHTSDNRNAVFSPDGKKVLTASNDGTAKIWDVLTGRLFADLKGHTTILSTASFSSDGKKVVTASDDHTAKIWDAISGMLLYDLKGHKAFVSNACFSPDDKKIVTASWDSTAKIWDAQSGALLFDLKGHTQEVEGAGFSPDSRKVVTTTRDSIGKIWDAQSGALLADLKGHSDWVTSACFSPDSKKIVTTSGDHTAKIWDAKTGALLINLKGHNKWVNSATFSIDGKKIVTSSEDNTAKIWDAKTGSLLTDLKGYSANTSDANFSPDGRKIVTISGIIIKIWDPVNGKQLANLKGHTGKVTSAYFSFDSKKIVTASWDSTVKIWDVVNGKQLANFTEHTGGLTTACFSPDDKRIVTASWGGVKIWDAETGAFLSELKRDTFFVNSAGFSPDGQKIVTASWGGVKIWNAATGTLIDELKEEDFRFFSNACFSPDGKKIVTAGFLAKIWDVGTGSFLKELKGHTRSIQTARFSPDGKKIVTASFDHTAKIWDAQTGTLLADLKGHTSPVGSACFSSSGQRILTSSEDNTSKIWDADTGSLIYTFFAVDSSDYMIVDKDNHYDGTTAARKLLYYTCGTEIIELKQLKDKLWVPNLADRINRGDSINAPKLSELNICGLIPTVEQIENKITYQFKITPRRGGLGETILYVNGIETIKFNTSMLKKVVDGYELLVPKEDLKQYFVAAKENIVSVKAYTKENDISSRGVTVLEAATTKDATVPNLYAVVIGVSDYKGDELDLKYAAKDAEDFSNAVSLSARKLLGREHVFIYDLTTATERYMLPEKKSIKNVFAEIGNKATANDILLIFFAGHGVVAGAGKQFYFLTADASTSSITPTGVKDVAISAAELMDWMKPATIKAQKRILILDACQSGSAINQMVNIGKDQGYLAARNDDKAEEIKQIDKLNEKAGLYILAASASDQSAYEMGRYSQGLLTYALLKVIKEHPEVLEQNKFLNVSGWFNEAQKIVTNIVRESSLRQEPQLITTTNFNIGVVDAEILSKIILPGEKLLFGESNFQNTNVDYDNMELSKEVNRKLNEVSSRGSDAGITYMTTTDSPDAYVISGRYELKGDEITIKVNIRQSKESVPRYRFEINGNKGDMKSIAEIIVQRAIESIGKNK